MNKFFFLIISISITSKIFTVIPTLPAEYWEHQLKREKEKTTKRNSKEVANTKSEIKEFEMK